MMDFENECYNYVTLYARKIVSFLEYFFRSKNIN